MGELFMSICIVILHTACVECFNNGTKVNWTRPNTMRQDETILDSFEPVGCFRDRGRPRAFPNFIKSFKKLLDWHNMTVSFKLIVHACAEMVSKKYGFRYFGVQAHHECWSGKNGSLTYNRHGKSNNCAENYVGKSWANFVYRFVDVNGSWSHWSSWQPCSAKCGGGNITRVRTCTEPRPKWEGKDCIGMNVSSEKCNQHRCDDPKGHGLENNVTDKQGQSSDRPSLLAPIVGSSCLFLLCLVGVAWLIIRYLKKRRANSEITDQWEVLFDDISLCKNIGEGAFGKVYSGELLKQTDATNRRKKSARWRKKQAKEEKAGLKVAVKMLRNGATEEQKREFLEEIELMKQIGYHRNILNLLACCTMTVPMFLVVEFAKYGDLRQYLRQRREQIKQAVEEMGDDTLCNTGYQNMGMINETVYDCASDGYKCALTGHKALMTNSAGVNDDAKLTPADLMTFAWQIAKGMEFLSRKGFVHRDLAARNVLVCDGRLVKVADFGLSRYVYEEKVYHCKKARKLPIKWMSPEAIHDQVFTVESDVWAYGVLLWEMGTIGGTPYPTISNQRLLNLLNSGYRMEKPEMCSEEMYELMQQCWRAKPVERPSFTFIREQLEQVMLRHCSYLDLSNASQDCHAPCCDRESHEENQQQNTAL